MPGVHAPTSDPLPDSSPYMSWPIQQLTWFGACSWFCVLLLIIIAPVTLPHAAMLCWFVMQVLQKDGSWSPLLETVESVQVEMVPATLTR